MAQYSGSICITFDIFCGGLYIGRTNDCTQHIVRFAPSIDHIKGDLRKEGWIQRFEFDPGDEDSRDWLCPTCRDLLRSRLEDAAEAATDD